MDCVNTLAGRSVSGVAVYLQQVFAYLTRNRSIIAAIQKRGNSEKLVQPLKSLSGRAKFTPNQMQENNY